MPDFNLVLRRIMVVATAHVHSTARYLHDHVTSCDMCDVRRQYRKCAVKCAYTVAAKQSAIGVTTSYHSISQCLAGPEVKIPWFWIYAKGVHCILQ